MFTKVPEKILAIIHDIETHGCVTVSRLTVVKKWFEHPGRLSAFGLWIARKVSGRKGKMKGVEGDLLNQTRKLLGTSATRKSLFQQIDREAAKNLHDRVRDFQNEYEKHKWGSVRIVNCWPLLLVEQGLALHLGLATLPADGFRLAADWVKNFNRKYIYDMNGPSVGRLQELMRFMFSVEGLEEHPE